MRRVTKIETYDGKIHDTEAAARKHLDAQYADVLCRLAHKLTAAEKYANICEVLDASGDALRAMLAIKADLAIEPREED